MLRHWVQRNGNVVVGRTALSLLLQSSERQGKIATFSRSIDSILHGGVALGEASSILF